MSTVCATDSEILKTISFGLTRGHYQGAAIPTRERPGGLPPGLGFAFTTPGSQGVRMDSLWVRGCPLSVHWSRRTMISFATPGLSSKRIESSEESRIVAGPLSTETVRLLGVSPLHRIGTVNPSRPGRIV